MSSVFKVDFWSKHLKLSQIKKECKDFCVEMAENKTLVIRKKIDY